MRENTNNAEFRPVDSYSISARILKQLYTQEFYVKNLVTGSPPVRFEIPTQPIGWPRKGLEGYAILVNCDHPHYGRVRSVLKIFLLDVPERRDRSRFIINFGLAGQHAWLFSGVPYAALPGTVINGIRVIGHVTKQVGAEFGGQAEDFRHLKELDKWDHVGQEVRRRLAGHLCCAVAALEKIGLVHGDLSSGNIMIGPGPDQERVCILCDFDGFYHPSQRHLPRHHNGVPCRPLGSPGYQYPELLKDLTADRHASDDSILVRTDRFALGALACEMMVWSSAVERELGRAEVLDRPTVSQANVNLIPTSVCKLWPDGFERLQSALEAATVDEMPGANEWLDALGVVIVAGPAFEGRPYIRISKRSGRQLKPVRDVLLVSDRGDLGPVSAELSALGYEFSSAKLKLNVGWPHPIFVLRRGRRQVVGSSPQVVELWPEDVVSSNFWEVKVYDETE